MYKRYPAHRLDAERGGRHAPAPAHRGKKRGGRRRAPLVAVVSGAAVCAVALAVAVGFGALSPAQADDGWYDGAAAAGGYEGKSEEAVRAELEKKVAEGMMNISISSDIQASAQTGEAEARIENIAANRVDQKVTLTRVDTGEVLYASDAIAPGNHIQTVKLDPMPEPGTYDVLATFSGYDPETHEQVGTSAAEIKLTVEA